MAYKITVILENEDDQDDIETNSWIGIHLASEAIRLAADHLGEKYPLVIKRERQARTH